MDGAPARQVLLSLLLNSPVPLVCCSIGTSVGIPARRLGRLGSLVRRLGSSSARRLSSSCRLCSRVVDGIDGLSRRRFGSAQLVGLAQIIVGGARRVGSVLVSLMARLVSSARLLLLSVGLSGRLCARVVNGSTRQLSSSSARRLARRVATVILWVPEYVLLIFKLRVPEYA